MAQRSEAIQKALQLVELKADSLKADEFILLDYVGRRFGFDIIDKKSSKQILNRYFGKDSTETLVFQFRSLVTSSDHWVNVGKASHPIDSVSLMALGCRNGFEKGAYISKLRAHGLKGGYFLTHALVSLQWALEQGCLIENDQEVHTLKDELQRACFEFAVNSSAPQDERFEAACMLYYSGYDPQKLLPFRKEVLEHQLPDGGWASSERSELSSLHTTAFALWILLEAEIGNKNQHPAWIVR